MCSKGHQKRKYGPYKTPFFLKAFFSLEIDPNFPSLLQLIFSLFVPSETKTWFPLRYTQKKEKSAVSRIYATQCPLSKNPRTSNKVAMSWMAAKIDPNRILFMVDAESYSLWIRSNYARGKYFSSYKWRVDCTLSELAFKVILERTFYLPRVLISCDKVDCISSFGRLFFIGVLVLAFNWFRRGKGHSLILSVEMFRSFNLFWGR